LADSYKIVFESSKERKRKKQLPITSAKPHTPEKGVRALATRYGQE